MPNSATRPDRARLTPEMATAAGPSVWQVLPASLGRIEDRKRDIGWLVSRVSDQQVRVWSAGVGRSIGIRIAIGICSAIVIRARIQLRQGHRSSTLLAQGERCRSS